MADPTASSGGRVTVVLTSPRLPAGLLTGTAWRALYSADWVASYDVEGQVARALAAEGVAVHGWPDASAPAIIERAQGLALVWLASDDGDEDLIRDLAAHVARSPEAAAGDVEIEILVGSFDPVGARLLDLVAVMDRLRLDCPWDREQTHESLVRYLVEEAYETIEAIESGDRAHLREELGDLLLQVVFHARVASDDDDDPFAIDDVAAGIVEKLIRRHPHVFGGNEVTDAAAVERTWEAAKSAEKGRASTMDGIPAGLPALSLAEKVIGRALTSQMTLRVPMPTETSYTAQSLGEVLFALVAASRAGGIDAEQALRARVAQEVAEVRMLEQRAGQDTTSHRG